MHFLDNVDFQFWTNRCSGPVKSVAGVNAGAKNRPPKGKGGPRLGSVDKDWVPS
jgi:hypothetical protein